MSHGRVNFRLRVGQGKDNWVIRHLLNLVGTQNVGVGQANKDVSVANGFVQVSISSLVTALLNQVRLVVVVVLTISVNRAINVNEGDVLDSGREKKAGGRNP